MAVRSRPCIPTLSRNAEAHLRDLDPRDDVSVCISLHDPGPSSRRSTPEAALDPQTPTHPTYYTHLSSQANKTHEYIFRSSGLLQGALIGRHVERLQVRTNRVKRALLLLGVGDGEGTHVVGHDRIHERRALLEFGGRREVHRVKVLLDREL